jgi:hypothetical protein
VEAQCRIEAELVAVGDQPGSGIEQSRPNRNSLNADGASRCCRDRLFCNSGTATYQSLPSLDVAFADLTTGIRGWCPGGQD